MILAELGNGLGHDFADLFLQLDDIGLFFCCQDLRGN